jgi:2-oxoglutarate dehydrogenase E1 component
MDFWSEFHGPNAGYIVECYERYRHDPASVDAEMRAFFDELAPPYVEALQGEIPVRVAQKEADESLQVISSLDVEKIAGVNNLAQAIRWYGHLAARLDPLGTPPLDDPSLHLSTYNLTDDDLRGIPARVVGGVAAEVVGQQGGSAYEAVRYLRDIYSSNIGFDYIQNRNPEERQWLREAAESSRFSPLHTPIDRTALLQRLTQVEAFEHFLQRTFVAKTRFSIEGLDMLIPMLDTINVHAAESGMDNILLGMAHRGRLNVLAHILNKPINQILAEFKDPLQPRLTSSEQSGFSGDVKYHAGGQTIFDEDNDQDLVNLTITMAPNPSHLEAVNPVVEGMARALGTQADSGGPTRFEPSITLPVLIHGDAAFPGQGVVAETLNMYRLEGYSTGGTIHIIANNQIGFTTNPNDSRSTLFASDLAKGYRIPIIHVNADDPEACITAARTAFAYRAQFQRDFVIDLIGYRRRGHNEGDEGAFTQPKVYALIEEHPSVRKQWADTLVEQGVVEAEVPEQLYNEMLARFQDAMEQLDPEQLREPIPEPAPPGAARRVRTNVEMERLARLNKELLQLSEGFKLHPRLARIRQRREWSPQNKSELEKVPVDWATAEELSFASILEEGIPIRITGQDVERGTFSHRHAVLHDADTGQRFIPLQSLPDARAGFEIYNSPLSEYAALGFEFGYSIQSPGTLVVWEAQYGDFINNAQTIMDEFIVSAREKWGQLPSLVILLPHGYEGQGPDHSSGRLERFLNLSADENIRVANCTTAANYFHLLRRQALLLHEDPLPLIVMTPKSLLRHPLVSSPLRALSESGWQPVIDRQPPPVTSENEKPVELSPVHQVRRMILCSGKVYADLVTSDLFPQHPEVGVARVEQLAPFPTLDLLNMLDAYPMLEEMVWVQEEPENMGPWWFCRPYLRQIMDELQSNRELPVALYSLTRARSSSPAEGSSNLHAYNQRKLIEGAFEKQFEPYSRHAKRRKIWAAAGR